MTNTISLITSIFLMIRRNLNNKKSSYDWTFQFENLLLLD
jgi:hypothetical protein